MHVRFSNLIFISRLESVASKNTNNRLPFIYENGCDSENKGINVTDIHSLTVLRSRKKLIGNLLCDTIMA